MTQAAFLADLVLALHAAVVAYVVVGQALIIAGGLAGWRWIRGWIFRASHLGVMAYVAAQSWLGAVCPLTTLELDLRREAGQATHDQSFIGYWLSRLIFWEAPGWVFVLVYTVFTGVVALSWWWWPPRRRSRHANPGR